MALFVKNRPARAAGPSGGEALIEQLIKVSRAAKTVPQSTTEILFKVIGGRVKVKALLGEVTTVISGTDPQISLLSKKLNAALDTAVGTAVTLMSSATIAALEVGGLVLVEGDGTALVKSNAGAVFIGSQGGEFIVPNGEIYCNAAASSTTGAMKWDLWYEPLDAGAYVIAVDTATAAV